MDYRERWSHARDTPPYLPQHNRMGRLLWENIGPLYKINIYSCEFNWIQKERNVIFGEQKQSTKDIHQRCHLIQFPPHRLHTSLRRHHTCLMQAHSGLTHGLCRHHTCPMQAHKGPMQAHTGPTHALCRLTHALCRPHTCSTHVPDGQNNIYI